MAVAIRLARQGAKKRPFYRVVATDKRSPRDGRFIEQLGTYDSPGKSISPGPGPVPAVVARQWRYAVSHRCVFSQKSRKGKCLKT